MLAALTVRDIVLIEQAVLEFGPGLNVLTGINHDLHTTGTPDNDAVLAPSVVAALKAWAQPYAPAG